MLDELRSSFIDGHFVAASTARDLINPTDEQAFHTVADATSADVDTAAQNAYVAWENTWRDLSPGQRSELLHRLANLIEANAPQLAALDSRSMGKPIAAARGEVLMGAR